MLIHTRLLNTSSLRPCACLLGIARLRAAPAVVWLPARPIGFASEESTFRIHVSQSGQRRRQPRLPHHRRHRLLPRRNAIRHPVIPIREMIDSRVRGRQPNPSPIDIGRSDLSGYLLRLSRRHRGRLYKCQSNRIQITIDAHVSPVSKPYVERVRRSLDEVGLTPHIRLQVQRSDARQQRHLRMRHVLFRRQIVKRQHRILAQIDRRCIFKLNLRAAVACHQAEARLQRQIHSSLLPHRSAIMPVHAAPRKPHIALHVAQPHNLRHHRLRKLRGHRRILRLVLNVRHRLLRRNVQRDTNGQKRNCKVDASIEIHGSLHRRASRSRNLVLEQLSEPRRDGLPFRVAGSTRAT